MTHLTIYLASTEREALAKLARRELRNPRAQAAILIRQALEKAGLLPVTSRATSTPAALDSEGKPVSAPD